MSSSSSSSSRVSQTFAASTPFAAPAVADDDDDDATATATAGRNNGKSEAQRAQEEYERELRAQQRQQQLDAPASSSSSSSSSDSSSSSSSSSSDSSESLPPITFERGRLSLVGRALTSLPADTLAADAYASTRELDLSHNDLRTLAPSSALAPLARTLQQLVLDSNALDDAGLVLPSLPALHTLWLNNNTLTDIEAALRVVAAAAPRIAYLSLLKNPCCPNELLGGGKDEDDYRRYRLFVLHRLPSLRFLDSRAVTADERAEAKRVGHLMVVAREQRPIADDARSDSGGGGGGGDGGGGGGDDGEIGVTALPQTLTEPGAAAASFGVSRFNYRGHASEGNRFILNTDL